MPILKGLLKKKHDPAEGLVGFNFYNALKTVFYVVTKAPNSEDCFESLCRHSLNREGRDYNGCSGACLRTNDFYEKGAGGHWVVVKSNKKERGKKNEEAVACIVDSIGHLPERGALVDPPISSSGSWARIESRTNRRRNQHG